MKRPGDGALGALAELSPTKLVLPALELGFQHPQARKLLALADDGMQMFRRTVVQPPCRRLRAPRSMPLDAYDPAIGDLRTTEAQPQDGPDVEEHQDDDEPRQLRKVANKRVVGRDDVIEAIGPYEQESDTDDASDDIWHGLHLLNARC
jgi:hypothetical protein